MLKSLLPFVFLSALLTGCVLPGSVSAPTPYPADYIPTVIFLTAQSINAATIQAIATPSPAPVSTEPLSTEVPQEAPTLADTPVIDTTPLPTLTFTPGPGIPLAAIQIKSPGSMSRVASPLDVHVIAVAGESHRLELDLFGEDGRLIGRTLLVVSGYPGGDTLSIKMPFEIRAAGENATVQLSTKDAHGRIQSLNSVRVLLMSTGASQITPPGNNIYERVAFYDLPPDSHVSGGVLAVKGSYQPVNGKPVILELMTADGRSLGLRVLDLPGLKPQFFSTTIPYKVTQETAARLYIYQDDEIIQGRAYLYSQPLSLNP